jgi:hypothetical protein
VGFNLGFRIRSLHAQNGDGKADGQQALSNLHMDFLRQSATQCNTLMSTRGSTSPVYKA